ncbi:right-handed parallel beta-helix repeat-containing protein [Salipiger mucosus]|uniref:Right handed beta helix domain-containing protein n=1 Tax=Salipiger mucosus DSM 16094 TaxID=1123237 RepID=S9QXA4_9RHOB|nr:right-handed parallel beta-helix repeat-containing protein [Salipiger mucosus]EPX86001.1 hypothetical protein Salmuc_00817 [Salipiger mucosus DSM 16094]
MPERLRTGTAAALLAALLSAPLPGAAQEAVTVAVQDARLALMQLAAGTGRSQSGLLDAASRAIYLQDGSATLSELDAAADEAGSLDAMTAGANGTVTAHRPIVVLQGAELRLDPGDRLALDRRAGAFVLSLGATVFDGAEVAVTGGRHPRVDGFRPFIAGLGETSLTLQDTTFTGLGYNAESTTSGVSLVGGGLLASGTAAPVTGNTFENLRTVSLSELDTLEVTGNRVTEARGSGLRIRSVREARIQDNLVARPHGAEALHASGLARATISGNRFEAGQGKGVRIDDASRELRFTGNRVAGFDGSGVTLAEGAECVLLAQNEVADNRGSGISVRDAGTFILSGNEVRDNMGPGIGVIAQADGSEGLILRNVFSGNRQGIRATRVTRLRLAENDLSKQMPRLFGGDLDQHTPGWLKDRRADGATSMVLEEAAARTDAALRRNAAADAYAACSQTEGGV